MTTTTSNPFRLNITLSETGPFVPPYSLPTVGGDVVSIGTNTLNSVKPSVASQSNWEYSFANGYAGGRFGEEYSLGGAYVIAGSGGHQVPPCMIGACGFDFENATWFRVETVGTPGYVNGIPIRNSPDYQDNEAVAGEIVGSSPPMPCPQHSYQLSQYLPPARGGGPKGSYLLLKGHFGGAQTNDPINAAYTFNLDTGVWNKKSTNNAAGASSGHRGSAYDPVTDRYYISREAMYATNSMPYLDGADWTYKSFGYSATNVRSEDGSLFFEPVRRILILSSSMTDSPRDFVLRGRDIVTYGIWTFLTISPQPTNIVDRVLLPLAQWAYYPDDGCYYSHVGEQDSSSGDTIYIPSNKIWRLQPPIYDGVNKYTGTWTLTMLTLNQTLNPQPPRAGDGAVHYTRFFYVPAINCLAWISGRAHDQVQLIKPPAL